MAQTANLRLITADMVRTPRVIISTKPVLVPDDLEGMSARIANVPMQQKFFSYWGCSTNQISFAEYPMALMQGVINCGETSCESFSTSKFHLYAPYIAMVDFAYPLDCIVMSNKHLDGADTRAVSSVGVSRSGDTLQTSAGCRNG